MSDVSVRVAAFQISVTNVPYEVNVRALYVQIATGNAVIDEASDVEAFNTEVFVFALIIVANEVEAVVMSDWTANEPDVKPAPVRVRVPNVQTSEAVKLVEFVTRCLPIVPAPVSVDDATSQTSAAKVPNVVNDLVPLAQTAVGIVATRDDDAVRTVALVLLLIVVIAEEICELVLVLMFEANEVEAERIVVLTADVIPEV